jgi:hypothetical protein
MLGLLLLLMLLLMLGLLLLLMLVPVLPLAIIVKAFILHKYVASFIKILTFNHFVHIVEGVIIPC